MKNSRQRVTKGDPGRWATVISVIVLAALALSLSACEATTSTSSTVGQPGGVDTSVPVDTEVSPSSSSSTTLFVDPNVDPVLGIVPPVPADPIVDSSFAHMEWMAACAWEAGVEVEVLSQANPGLATVGVSTPRKNEVTERCMEFSREQDWLIPYPFDGSEDANRLLYGIWIEIHECLVANGYPTTDPPSEDVFVEGGEGTWNPFKGMMGDIISVSLNADLGPSGTLPGGLVRQLEAQDLCGASPGEIYAQRLAAGGSS